MGLDCGPAGLLAISLHPGNQVGFTHRPALSQAYILEKLLLVAGTYNLYFVGCFLI